ncbi:MAG: helix-turn-helix domain-containing protein [Betaproteobacteria bacterium]|nr:helix-turn-helix domain-containing protein [Betaproteobacteria bacterium]
MSAESDQPSAPELDTPGAQLGRLRAARELSIADVAERIKYSARQIEALEADDYSKLPGTTFVRGMIRGYAKLLQTDPVPVLRQFEDRHLPEQIILVVPSEHIPFPDGKARATRMYLGLGGLALVAAAAIMFEWQFGLGVSLLKDPQPPVPVPPAVVQQAIVPEPPVEQPLSVPPPEPDVRVEQLPALASVSGDAKRILLEFQKESWVEIKDRVGNTLLSRLNPAGSTAAVQGSPPFSLVIGNAHNVRLTYDDATVDLEPYVSIEVARLTLK